MDAKQLEYISSAGLRVLMMAVKKLGKVSVINTPQAVKEIFETTGFDQLMSVE
ncbi:MAG: STAS domain-containing protein [Oscillospiraceae bacterium]|nr:STAS domain-containing protein [Oscillospiraceae bacterium]